MRKEKIRKNVFSILLIFLVVWFIFSASYLISGLFQKWYTGAINRGYVSAVQDLLNEVEKHGCQPFSVFLEDVKINLINADCYQIIGTNTDL
jgi:Fe2+ transport system protein B